MVLALKGSSATFLPGENIGKGGKIKTRLKSTWSTINQLQGLALATFKERR
jgi:hypothetical protein